ncbi:MAG: sulfatase, partial [Planctomycetes bacterium]|nr:sulfatase [Planctomycetota bacterium]
LPGILGLLFLAGHLVRFTVHPYGAMLLAGGLAMQVARLIRRHTEGFYRLVKRSTAWMAILVAGLALAVPTGRWWAERRALAALAPAAADAANVLLITLDTVRAQSLSLYGHERLTTPELQRFAETGVVFQRALATAPWTLPSHASMFTGRFASEMSADFQTPLDARDPTLAEVLSARGYVTAGFVANYLYCGAHTGLGRGFAHYEDQPRVGWIIEDSTVGQIIRNSDKIARFLGVDRKGPLFHKDAAMLNRDFLRWLPHQGRRPFFAFLNYYDAHEPYMAPRPFDREFRSSSITSPIQADLDAYEGSIAYLDHHLGRLFRELDERGILSNTLVLITSDHGEHFGEHGLRFHSNSLYAQLLHVPLVISFPARVPSGKRVESTISLRELPATVVDLLGMVDVNCFPAPSLARHWQVAKSAEGAPKGTVLSEVSCWQYTTGGPNQKGPMKALVADSLHYIKNYGDGREELYDFESDPREERDLASLPERQRVLERLRASLEQISKGRFAGYLAEKQRQEGSENAGNDRSVASTKQ